ncbi:MAG: hypothetical protein NC131_21720 [Roseburia sp.]|nr:hypothetical protein [Roseburia sp.]
MKQTFIVFLLSFLVLSAAAQDEAKTATRHWRPKYRNLNFNSEKITLDGFSLDSKFGAAFTTGRTYFLHKTPILRMIRIGIDATWFDISYANYKTQWLDYGDEDYYSYDDYYGDDEDYDDEITIHKAEIGMQVGPSVTVNPVDKLNVHGYFRYAPTFAMMYDDDAFRGNYASMFVTGISLSYGAIGFGIEKRWGTCKYKELFSDSDDDYDYDYSSPDAFKWKTSGLRVYLSFRFKH